MEGLEQGINTLIEPLATIASEVIFFSVSVAGADIPLIVVWLILAGIIFTLYFKGVQLWGFRHAIELVRGRHSESDDPGELSPFQALCTALSGTVGLGNIAGVAVAVTLGGPGATFWMIIAGLMGMCVKFAECTLGVKYREIDENGRVSGGPFKYLPVAFARLKVPFLPKLFTGLFSVGIFFFGATGIAMFQSNQTFAQARNVMGGRDGFLGGYAGAFAFGLILAVLAGAVLSGGIKSIGRVTSRLVPFMVVIYMLGCSVVILTNAESIPTAIGEIIVGAFSPQGVAGGVLGSIIIGFQRGAFSNEAGVGSAPTAHAAVKTKHPVTEGFVALLEPFIDTVVVCTMTALTIVIARPQIWLDARASRSAEVGVVITSDAFATVMPWFPYVLALAIALFAFSSVISWYYYTVKAWTTLVGRSQAKERLCLVIYCGFIVIGTMLTFTQVLTLADSMLFLAALFNLAGVYLLLPVVRRELRDYLQHRRVGRSTDDRTEADAGVHS
jgi:AGCS family alanine or glycine:cation symporter